MNQLTPFKLEEYFAQYEFSTPYPLCMSDSEPYSMREILDLADDECRRLWDNLSLCYTESKGLPLLRQEIARSYQTIDSDDVLCHAGAEEALYCVIKCMVQPDDHVVVVTPCYQSLEAIPRAIGASVTSIQLDEANGWSLDLNQLSEALSKPTKMIIMNFPHNPTGTMLSRSDLEATIQMARNQGCYILCDEVYRLMELDSRDRLPALADVYERGISINVMTKAYGLASLRIGWIACRDVSVIKQTAAYKHYTTICNAGPSEILALIALRNAESLLARNHAIRASNLALIDQLFVEEAERLSWHRPKGGCIGFVKVSDQYPVDQLAEELVKEVGVLILPARVYDYPGNYFRIGFGRKGMPEALTRFAIKINA